MSLQWQEFRKNAVVGERRSLSGRPVGSLGHGEVLTRLVTYVLRAVLRAPMTGNSPVVYALQILGAPRPRTSNPACGSEDLTSSHAHQDIPRMDLILGHLQPRPAQIPFLGQSLAARCLQG
jgi:hypothetical protein